MSPLAFPLADLNTTTKAISSAKHLFHPHQSNRRTFFFLSPKTQKSKPHSQYQHTINRTRQNKQQNKHMTLIARKQINPQHHTTPIHDETRHNADKVDDNDRSTQKTIWKVESGKYKNRTEHAGIILCENDRFPIAVHDINRRFRFVLNDCPRLLRVANEFTHRCCRGGRTRSAAQ